MKHTKLPWHVGMKPGPMIYGTKGEQIADMMEANGEADLFPYVGENQANAAFIVRACNSHYELIAALEELTKSYHSKSMMPVDKFPAMWAFCESAIAKAKGE